MEVIEMELMTREEMIKRLQAGEDALELSIEKWDRIWRALVMKQRRGLKPTEYHSDTCALCTGYTETECTVCVECPYYLRYGKRCDSEGMHWVVFFVEQSARNARRMRDALIECRQNS